MEDIFPLAVSYLESLYSACTPLRFSHELSLPALPEMVFPESWLRVELEGVGPPGCAMEFNALGALKMVDATAEPVKVAAAAEWGKTRYILEIMPSPSS